VKCPYKKWAFVSVIARLGYDNNNNNHIEVGYNKIRIPQAVLVPLLVKKI